MDNLIIIGILAVIIVIGVISTVKHFQGKGACCGGGSGSVRSQKKIKNVVAKKTLVVEGMMCENCRNRVEWAINDIEGAVAKVDLKKKEAVVSMNREIADDVLRAAVEKAGYEVKEIR